MVKERQENKITLKDASEFTVQLKREIIKPTIERFGGDEKVIEKLAEYGQGLLENDKKITVVTRPWSFEFSKSDNSVHVSMTKVKGHILISDVKKIEKDEETGSLIFTYYKQGEKDPSKFEAAFPNKKI